MNGDRGGDHAGVLDHRHRLNSCQSEMGRTETGLQLGMCSCLDDGLVLWPVALVRV